MKLLLAAVLAATITGSAPTPLEKSFLQGETLDYNVHWMKIAAGTGRVTIAPAGEDRYRITSVVRSGGGIGRWIKVRDEIETLVERGNFSTTRIAKKLDERGDKLEETTVIADGVATRRREQVRKLPVPYPVSDPISVIQYLRTFDLTPGKTYELKVYADLKLYTVHVRVLRGEVVDTPAGRFNTVLVEPEMASGGRPREERLHIWYSDDERRLPVRIRTEVNFGSVTATLKAVSSGVSSIEPPLLAVPK